MNISKDKQFILDYIAGLEDPAYIIELKNFIETLKNEDELKAYSQDNESLSEVQEPVKEYKKKEEFAEKEEYELTKKGLKVLVERRQEYLNGDKTLSEQEANELAQKWL